VVELVSLPGHYCSPPHHCQGLFDFTLTDNFQYQSVFAHASFISVDQGQFSHPDFISGTHQRDNKGSLPSGNDIS
jgi:hypothetical protein